MKKKLLWVEDDALLGRILSREIENSEFDLIQAKTGQEAMELLKGIVPDIIMVDLMLPGGMDGFAILEATDADPRLKDIPKLVLSNLSRESDLERARKLGAKRFLIKADMSLEIIMSELRDIAAHTIVRTAPPKEANS